jgi:hypothetical protein
MPNTSGAGVATAWIPDGVAVVIATGWALAARAASRACASWLLNSAQEKSVATIEAVTSEMCAFFAFCAAALDCCTFLLIEGSGLFEYLDAILFQCEGLALQPPTY